MEGRHDIWMTHRNCKWCARVWLWRMEIGNKYKWQPIDLSRSLSLFSGCSASIVLSVCAFIYTLININAIKVGAIYFISTSLPSLAHSGVAHFVIVNNRFDIKKRANKTQDSSAFHVFMLELRSLTLTLWTFLCVCLDSDFDFGNGK